jgi:RNA polymerase sigma-70 factor (ECF subfamily)
LIKAYEQPAFAMAMSYLGDYEMAAEVTQEALIKVYKNLGKFKFEASLSTWIYRIVINTCKDALKKTKRMKEVSLEDNHFEGLRDEQKTPEETLETEDLKTMVHRTLETINPENAEVIRLKDIQDYSYEEIAAFLEIPVGTVRSRLSRGRQMLKEAIVKAYPDALSLIR